jgi:hypothetical protein
VSFTAPSLQLNGQPLAGDITANIYRDSEQSAVATIPVVAGQNASWTDNTVAGVDIHTYTVAIENEMGEGKRAQACKIRVK